MCGKWNAAARVSANANVNANVNINVSEHLRDKNCILTADAADAADAADDVLKDAWGSDLI